VLLDDESDLTLEDILPDCDQPDPDSVVETAELWRTVAEGVALLPPRERTIIEQHYSQDVSLRELGQRLAISQSRVYQIHHRAIRRLRSHVDSALSHGRTLATAGMGGLHIWDARTGKQLRTYSSPETRFTSAAFTPENAPRGRRLNALRPNHAVVPPGARPTHAGSRRSFRAFATPNRVNGMRRAGTSVAEPAR